MIGQVMQMFVLIVEIVSGLMRNTLFLESVQCFLLLQTLIVLYIHFLSLHIT